MKKICLILAVLATLLCISCTASCETIVKSDGDIQATFTLDTEAAYIGQPYTLSYELSGGSGEFNDVQIMYNYDFDWGGGRGYLDNGSYGASADYTLLPEMGMQLSFSVYGSDSAGRDFYIDTPAIPLYPNPDLPVTLTFDSGSAVAGTPFSGTYAIAGCQDFNGTISWTVCNSQTYENSTNVGTQTIEAPGGNVLFTPSFGDSMYLVLSGQDDQGRLVYVESAKILIEGADEKPINFTYTLSADEAFIGQPVTLHYELSGGSGEFSNVQIMYNYDFGWGGGRGYLDNGSYGAVTDYTLLPEMGVQLCFSVYGSDSVGREFYFQTDVMPLHPNPDLPVTITFDKTQINLNETVTASYVIDGCKSVTGSSSWTIREEDEYQNSSEVDLKPLGAPAGEIKYSPSFGSKMWLVLQGQDDQGRFVYVESDAVEVGEYCKYGSANSPCEPGWWLDVENKRHARACFYHVEEKEDVNSHVLITPWEDCTPDEGGVCTGCGHDYDTSDEEPSYDDYDMYMMEAFFYYQEMYGASPVEVTEKDGKMTITFKDDFFTFMDEMGFPYGESVMVETDLTLEEVGGVWNVAASEYGPGPWLQRMGLIGISDVQVSGGKVTAEITLDGGEAYTLTAGSVSPVILPGDADGDGEVGIMDALAVLQAAVGWDVHVDLDAADVDDSGEVDILDALRILQYSVGWGVELL